MGIVLLLFLIFLIVQIPSVQTWLGHRLANYLTDEIGNKITLNKLHFNSWDDVELNKLLVLDAQNDTLLFVDHLEAKLGKLSLKQHLIRFDKVLLDKNFINLQKKKSLNLEKILNYFKQFQGGESDWFVGLKNIKITNTRFNYQDFNEATIANQIDYNHIKTRNLNLFIEDFIFYKSETKAQIKQLSFLESKGFQLDSLQVFAQIDSLKILTDALKIITPESKIQSNLAFHYLEFSDFQDFINKIRFESEFKNSTIAPNDLNYFVEKSNQIKSKINLSGKIRGKIKNLKGRNLAIALGEKTLFKGKVDFAGLPDLENTLINLKVEKAQFSRRDLQKIIPDLNIPLEVSDLGLISFTGRFDGFLKDFVAYGNFNTALGKIKSDLNLKLNQELPKYTGFIALQNFNLGKIIHQKNIKALTMEGEVEGKSFVVHDMEAKVKGKIFEVNFNDYLYKNVILDGKFNESLFDGKLDSKDPNVNFDFVGTIDFAKKLPEFNFTSNIKKIDLSKLNFIQEEGILSGNLEMHLIGNELDNLEGTIDLIELKYQNSEQFIGLKYFDFEAKNQSDSLRLFNFKSDLVDGKIEGNFEIQELIRASKDMAHRFLPNYFDADSTVSKQKFSFEVNAKNPQKILDFFYPNTYILDEFVATGFYNNINPKTRFELISPSFSYQNFKINDISFLVKSDSAKFKSNLFIEEILYKDSLWVNEFQVENQVFLDSVFFQSKINRDSSQNQIKLNGWTFLQDSIKQLQFENSVFRLADNVWKITEKNLVTYEDSIVNIENLKLSDGTHLIQIEGKVSDNQEDSLELIINDLNLEQFNNLLEPFKTKIAGHTSAQIKANALLSKTPKLLANFETCSFALDDEPIGDFEFNSEWNDEKSALEILARIYKRDFVPDDFHDHEEEMEAKKANLDFSVSQPFLVEGNVEYKNKKTKLDLNVELNKFSITPLNKLLNPILTDIEGMASAKLKLGGELYFPNLNGYADIDYAKLRVDYLNTDFQLKKTNNRIVFTDHSIEFNKMELEDKNGKKGILSGEIYHDYFRDILLNLRVDAVDNLLVLNTTAKDNDYFFGKAFATGYATFQGYTNDLDIYIKAKSNKNTKIDLPLEGSSYSSQNDFVFFVSNDSSEIEKEDKITLAGFGVKMDLEVTPDAQIRIIFDRIAGDIIQAQGKGDLKLDVDKRGNLNLYGNYLIQKGDYLFTYENILNKRFEINQGSSIAWNGDPYDAKLNIKAIYNLRTSAKDLIPSSEIDSTNSRLTRRLPVECVLSMNGSLLNPEIDFEINMPTINEDDFTDPIAIQLREINQNEQKRNEQIFGLLVLGRFLNTDNLVSLNGAGSNSVSELISNQISNLLSQYLKNVDIGFDYRDRQLFGDRGELQVFLSTTLFNDRVILDGNLDVGNEYLNQNIGADFSIEYKITPDGKLRIVAYNKIDDRQFLTNYQTNYQQGVGVSYQKEFDKIGDLFPRIKKWFRRKKKD